jgi:hypothetical protein
LIRLGRSLILVDHARRGRGVGKNHAMNTAKVSTLLDVLVPHRGAKEQDRAPPTLATVGP